MQEKPPQHLEQQPACHRRGFHRTYTHMLSAATPLIIGELIKDPERRWRWIRICSLLGVVVGELEMSWRDREKARKDCLRER